MKKHRKSLFIKQGSDNESDSSSSLIKKDNFTSESRSIEKIAQSLRDRSNSNDGIIKFSQRKGFQHSKFLQNQLTNQVSMSSTYDASNRTLSKVLISMPKVKLDKIYEMKLKTFQSIKEQSTSQKQTNQSSKYLNQSKSKIIEKNDFRKTILKTQSEKKIIVPKLVPNIITEETKASVKQVEQDGRSNSVNSSNSNESLGPYLLKRYRMRDQTELPLNNKKSRQPGQRHSSTGKQKILILTHRARLNMFKIKDHIQQKFEQGEESTEEKDSKLLFTKQNVPHNIFNFNPYFYHTFSSKNRGMQTTASHDTMGKVKEFEERILSIISRLEPSKSKSLPQK